MSVVFFLATAYCGEIVSDSPSGCRVCLDFMTAMHYTPGTGLIGDKCSKPLESSSKKPQQSPRGAFQKRVELLLEDRSFLEL